MEPSELLHARIPLAELFDLGVGLFPLHHRELGRDTPLSIDKAAWELLEEAGVLQVIGVFDGDALVGYSVATVTQHSITGQRVANSIAIYLLERFRGNGNGRRLITRAEIEAKHAGAVEMQWHARRGTKAALVFSRYTELETVYVRKF